MGSYEPDLAKLTGPRLSGALDRFEVLRPALEDGVPLVRAAKASGVPPRTAQRWMAAYKMEGLSVLSPKWRGTYRSLPPVVRSGLNLQ